MGALTYQPAVLRETSADNHTISYYAKEVKKILHDEKPEHL
jgi:hypothetical protein